MQRKRKDKNKFGIKTRREILIKIQKGGLLEGGIKFSFSKENTSFKEEERLLHSVEQYYV